MQQIIFTEEEAATGAPSGAFGITLGMIAPTILAHGTDEQRRHLPRMLGGEELWCQLFSEPGAGSDLAGMRTRADRDGDEWIVTGQKVWTSGGHYADWGYLIARTDPEMPKHRGLTAFLLPMDREGVTVRPLRQMTGGANFNEVFLDQVRIPDADRLDAAGSGWRVALTTLMNERFSAGAMAGGSDLVAAVGRLARDLGRSSDPTVRDRLAQLHIWAEVMRFTGYRSLTAISKGAVPGPEGSIAKLAATRLLRAAADLGVEIAGPDGMLAGDWSDLVCGVPGMRLGGGTDEIMKNIVAERVLGLPGEPRLDKDLPFAASVPTAS
jgi:acyl-CoA dehydrogenase